MEASWGLGDWGLGQDPGPGLPGVGGGPCTPLGRMAQPPFTICGVKSLSGLVLLQFLTCSGAPAARSPRLPPVMSCPGLQWVGPPWPDPGTLNNSSLHPGVVRLELRVATGGSRTKSRDQVLRRWLKCLDPALPKASLLGLVG